MSYKEIIEGLESMLLGYGRDQNARAIPCKGLTFRINHLKAAISALREWEWCFDMESAPRDGFFLSAKKNHGKPYVALAWRGHGQEIHHMSGADLIGEFYAWQPLPSPPMPEDK